MGKFFTDDYFEAVEAEEKVKPKRRRAPNRNRHVPTAKQRAQVEALSGFGVRQKDIARYIGVSHDVLRKYYRKHLDDGMVYAEAEVAKTLYDMAKSGRDFQATKFWLLQRSKEQWREVTRHEINVGDLREHARRRAHELGISEEEAAEIVSDVERRAKAGDL